MENDEERIISHRKANKKWRLANLEHARSKKREYHLKNRERENERSKKWNAAHPEQVRENREKWNAAHSEKIKEYRTKHNGMAKELLVKLVTWARSHLGDKCTECGADVNIMFHHDDPDSKLFNISRGLHRSTEEFLMELDKCVLLCKSCHTKIHHRRKNGG